MARPVQCRKGTTFASFSALTVPASLMNRRSAISDLVGYEPTPFGGVDESAGSTGTLSTSQSYTVLLLNQHRVLGSGCRASSWSTALV